MSKTRLPKYVWFGPPENNCAMKLKGYDRDTLDEDRDPPEYWRSAGLWGTNFKVGLDGVTIISCDWPEDIQHLNGITLTPCTEKEWKKSNKGYV